MLAQHQYQGPIHQHQANHDRSPRQFHRQYLFQNPIVLLAVKRHQHRQRHRLVDL
jgi:hypothetical protein